MNSLIVVALISSTTALIVAIYGTFSSVISSRRMHELSRSLEHFKVYLGLQNEELRDSLSGVNQGIQCIQKLKDQIWIILQALPQSINTRKQKDAVGVGVDAIVVAFEKYTPYLSETQREAFHRAKNLSLALKQEISQISDLSRLAPEVRVKLNEFRQEFSERQSELRDMKIDVLFPTLRNELGSSS